MLFPAVLMNFPNSKVCLIGEWSIQFSLTIFICIYKMLEAKPGFIINCVNVLWLKRFIY